MTPLTLVVLLAACSSYPDGQVEHREVYSEALDSTYTVSIYVPAEAEGISGVPWLLVLDGEYGDTEAYLSERAIQRGEAAPHVMVGIGNANLRGRDYTPTMQEGEAAEDDGAGGGLGDFVGWLEADFIPDIEAELDIGGDASRRALHGHSYGGIATMTSVFRYGHLWSGFGATSPSLWWDGGWVFSEEEAYAEAHDDLPVRLYMSVGQLEPSPMNPLFDEMVERLDARAYPGLDLEHEVLQRHEHYSGWEPGYAGLIPHLFPVEP